MNVLKIVFVACALASVSRAGVVNVDPTPAPPAHEVPPPPAPKPLPISPAPAGDAPEPPSAKGQKDQTPAPGSTIVVHPKGELPGDLARN